MRGRFITFEGGEGSGKSTQAQALADRLKSLAVGVVLTREPGGSPGAEVIRHVILSGAAKPLGAEAEAMLFAAAREDHIAHTIKPALDRGNQFVSRASAEPDDDGIPHPRQTAVLFGHVAAERMLLDAYRSARIPHA